MAEEGKMEDDTKCVGSSVCGDCTVRRSWLCWSPGPKWRNHLTGQAPQAPPSLPIVVRELLHPASSDNRDVLGIYMAMREAQPKLGMESPYLM